MVTTDATNTTTCVHYDVAAGTKGGDIEIIRFDLGLLNHKSDNDSTPLPGTTATRLATLSSRRDDTGSAFLKSSLKLPVFSLAVDSATATVYAGGGDRYMAVWQRSRGNQWHQQHRLGPHTGWVKAIALDEQTGRRRRIYSIGCNRIESWERSAGDLLDNVGEESDSASWTNAGTTSIASGPRTESDKVYTLSSDLLCLAVCCCAPVSSSSMDSHTISILAAGGVDGRIHFFRDNYEDCSNSLEKVGEVLVHQGRVNALRYATKDQMLFSSSHDGTVQCVSLAFEQPENHGSSPKLSVNRLSSCRIGADSRITALACWQTGSGAASLVLVAAGSQNGNVWLLALQGRDAPNCELEVVKCIQIEGSHLGGSAGKPPIVTALCPLVHADTTFVVVGHSLGLGCIRV